MELMNYLIMFFLSMPGIIIATTIHEYTRAMISTAYGDQLPQNMGRCTLNPIKHFEPIGFLLMFYSGGFGWGRPVETSPIHYKERKEAILWVAILPSVANLCVALIAIGIYTRITLPNIFIAMGIQYIAIYNVGIAVYNMIPVTPMDMAKLLPTFLPANKYYQYLQHEKMIQMGFLFLLFLGIGNWFIDPIIRFLISSFEKIFFLF